MRWLRRATPSHCPTCTAPARPGWRWCAVCGRRLNPTHRRRWTSRVLAVAVVVGFLASARVLFATLWAGDIVAAAGSGSTTTAPPPAVTVAAQPASGPVTTVPAPAPSQAVRPGNFTASQTAGPTQNRCGDKTTYDAANLLDGDPATAWRVKGDGTGQSVTFTFNGPTRLSQVALIPGYAKVDPCNGADRFQQWRRIVKVRWTFDGAATVEQSLADNPSLQPLAVDVVTTTATVQILAVTGNPVLDNTGMSEVAFLGGPA